MKNTKIKAKTKTISFYIIFGIFFGILLSFFYTKADAASISLAIDPPIIRIHAIPPADISASLAIQNLETEPVTLRVILKPFVPSEKENGELKYLTPGTSLSDETNFLQGVKLYDGDKLLNSGFVLAPRQQKKLILKLNIPKDYTYSEHYFSIIFLTSSEEGYESSRSYISGGIVSNILLSINKNAKIQGEIEDFKTQFFIKESPVAFEVKIKNKSKSFISPQGRILIKNMFGQTVGNIDLEPTNILANSSRFMTNQDTVSKNAFLYNRNFEKPKVYWSESFIIGYYTAELTASLSNQGPILTKSTYFLMLPIGEVILLTFFFIFLLFLIKRVKQKQISGS